MKKIQIVDGKVHWIFTLEQLPEWNPDDIHVVDYPADGYQPVEGDLYDEASGVFSPAPAVTPAHKTQFSVLDFRDRFTLAEQIAIRQAQLTDMEVGLVYDSFISAQFIDVTDERVGQGIDLYVSKGLLEPERKAELLEPQLIAPPAV